MYKAKEKFKANGKLYNVGDEVPFHPLWLEHGLIEEGKETKPTQAAKKETKPKQQPKKETK